MRKPAFFACASVLAGAMLLVCHSASARLPYWAQAGFHHHTSGRHAVARPQFVDRTQPRVIPARYVINPGPIDNGPVSNEPVYNRPISNGSVYNGPFSNGPFSNVAVYNRPVYDGPVSNGPVSNGIVYDRPIHNGPFYSVPVERGPFYSHSFDAPPVRLSAYQPTMAPPLSAQPMLSRAAWEVSQIAARNGDRVFLMMDKTRGKLFLFDNGIPVFTAAALTGASLADQLPSDALVKTIAQGNDLRYRVTPAGRFTVSLGHDHFYGDTLDINEIKGRNWIIAIHLAPNASRDARLRTPGSEDKHVTEGCINVTADTIHQLVRLLSGRARTPLYILPTDDREISRFF